MSSSEYLSLPAILMPLQSIDIADEEIGNLVDSILRDDDMNNDGYIDYYEFVEAQNRNRGEDTV